MQLHPEKPRLDATGARLVVIGNGSPGFIAGFRERTKYDGEIYTDPERRSYTALSFKRGARASVHPGTAFAVVRALAEGFRQTGVEGDGTQVGGVVIVAPSGEIVYRYASTHAGDHPAIDTLVDALSRR